MCLLNVTKAGTHETQPDWSPDSSTIPTHLKRTAVVSTLFPRSVAQSGDLRSEGMAAVVP
jgi:hypothetical protein